MAAKNNRDFKLEELSGFFHLPEKQVAKELGICLTSLKKLCRSYGITRWPFRKLKSISRMLKEEGGGGGERSRMVVEGQRLGGGDGASSKKAGGEAGVTPGDPDGKEDGKGKKKRQAYLLGGKTLLLSDEERSIYELTLGKGLYQVDAGPTPDAQPAQPPQQPSSSGPPAAPGGKAAAAIKGRASPTPSRAASHGPVSHAGSHAGASDGGAGRGAERDSSPAGAGFSCQAAGVTLEVWQWASLWTVEHLRARLLEPLSGVSMAVAPHVATLTFDTERTAMRAEVICRAAAMAAVNAREQKKTERMASTAHTPPQSMTISPPGSNSPVSFSGHPHPGSIVVLLSGQTRAYGKMENPLSAEFKEQLGSSHGPLQLQIPIRPTLGGSSSLSVSPMLPGPMLQGSVERGTPGGPGGQEGYAHEYLFQHHFSDEHCGEFGEAEGAAALLDAHDEVPRSAVTAHSLSDAKITADEDDIFWTTKTPPSSDTFKNQQDRWKPPQAPDQPPQPAPREEAREVAVAEASQGEYGPRGGDVAGGDVADGSPHGAEASQGVSCEAPAVEAHAACSGGESGGDG